MRARRVVGGIVSIVLMLAFLSSCAAPAMMGGQGGGPKPTGRVVGSQTLTAYSEKSFGGERVGYLRPGDTVVIEQESEGWSQVTFDNVSGRQVTGWIPADYLERGTAQNGGGKDLSGMKARTTVEGTLTGAGVGAAAGAIVAALVGVSPARGAVIGAAIGAPLGLAAGVYVANQKEKYATEEQYLDACIAESRQYNEEAGKDIAYMQNYIAEENVRIARLRREIARSESKKGLARAELKTMTAKKETMDKVITSLEGEAGAQQQALGSTTKDPDRIAALQREVESTRESIVKFKRERNQLVSAMAKTKELTL